MPDALTRLVYPPAPIDHPEDVARIRVALNAAGYDADAAAIQWAWREWSKKYYAAGWNGVTNRQDARLVKAVLQYLVPATDDGGTAP